ncbi:MAG: ABC-F family ATP-binding cassette domain-containing protein [Deltaproteobacteria bacterium]|nr:ABC-F family ATP-binding cassette domain-containing protein [Deltaproteobacteria bacterium]
MPATIMSLILNCQSVSKTYGAYPLFTGISLSFHKEERLGLIGPNGSGKSTLLRILAGLESPDAGEVSRKKDIRLAYISQQDLLDPEKSIETTLLSSLAGEAIEDVERYNRTRRWIGRAGFSDADQKVATLSGGWKKRLAIVSALILEPDLLLLDEPTNHLDLESIIWLEELLTNPPFGFILVSHDRYFLEAVTNRVVEINSRYPEGFLKVDGSYSEFIYYREAFLNSQVQIESVLANKVRRESEWLQRGPKARSTKARYRIDEAYRLKQQLSEVKNRNQQTQAVDIDFDSTRRKTKKLLTVKQIHKSLGGQNIFKDLSLTLTPGFCLGLLGRNGSGKSTLISVLAGHSKPDGGEIKWADGVKTILFEQDRSQLNQEQTLHQALCPTGDAVIFRERSIHVMSWAKRFLFKAEQLEMPVKQLSGGEQARIFIARLMLQPADILLLDEPTNDLDIPSLEVLEENLKDFPGSIVLVTHDRFLLNRLAKAVIGLDGNGVAIQFADYSQWLSSQKTEKIDRSATVEKPKTKQAKKKFSYKEQREWQSIEKEIMVAETEVEACQSEMLEPETTNDPERLRVCCDLLQSRQEEVERLYQRWEELDEIRQGFATQ